MQSLKKPVLRSTIDNDGTVRIGIGSTVHLAGKHTAVSN